MLFIKDPQGAEEKKKKKNRKDLCAYSTSSDSPE